MNDKKRFKKIYIEITNVCNLNCKFCSESKKPKKFLSEEEFIKIIEEIKEFTDYVYLHIKGEPLLHPSLYNFIEICKENKLQVNLTTNGSLIKNWGELSVRQINFSLTCYNDNENLTKQYIYDILDFATEASKNTYINLRIWNFNDKSLRNKELIDIISNRFSYTENYNITRGNGIRLAKNIFLQKERKFIWPDITSKETNKGCSCYALKDQVGILVDGSIVPCCLDSEGDILLGNIFENSFEEAINSDRAIKIYENFRNKKIVEKLCKTCGFNFLK